MKNKAKQTRLTHGMSYTRIYHIWQGMKQRVKGQSEKEYYFDKGISMCKEWQDSFELFYAWASDNGYSDQLSIDRINVNGDYEPSNCRWVDMSTQNQNKTNTSRIELNGQSRTLTEWHNILGIPLSTMVNRRNKGLPAELILMPGRFNTKKPEYERYLHNEKIT